MSAKDKVIGVIAWPVFLLGHLLALPVIAWRGFARGFRIVKGAHGRR